MTALMLAIWMPTRLALLAVLLLVAQYRCAHYVQVCVSCQRMTCTPRKPTGLFQPLKLS